MVVSNVFQDVTRALTWALSLVRLAGIVKYPCAETVLDRAKKSALDWSSMAMAFRFSNGV
jgi:hypothetical protein